MDIYWDGDENSDNNTYCDFGKDYNSVMTILGDSNSYPVAFGYEEDTIYVSGSKLIIPIVDFSLIENPQNPHLIEVTTKYDPEIGNVYSDELLFESKSGFISGYQIPVTIIGLTLIAGIIVIKVRKKVVK